MTIVDRGGSGNKLTQDVDRIGDVRTCNSKIDKTANEVTIASGIRKRVTIRGTKLNVELHRSHNCALITESSARKKILNIFFLGDVEAIRGRGDLNPKKIAKWTKVSHEELVVKASLNKGNVVRVITSDDHVINIEKEKSPSTRRRVNEQGGIMITGRETRGSHDRGEPLEPGTRGLFKTIERAAKTADHTIRNKVPRWWLHVNLLTQLTIEKSILNVKLRDRPVTNRSHSKESADSGHVGHRSESLIIIASLLLLKATSHKTSLVTLKRTIGASLNLIDPLARDGTNTRRRGNQIPHASALKRSNLLGHRKLPFRLSHGSPIGSGLNNGRETVPVRRIAIRWGERPSTKVVNRGRRGRRRAGSGRRVRRLMLNARAASVVKRKRRERPTDWRGWWRCGGWGRGGGRRRGWDRWCMRKSDTGRRRGRDMRHRGRCVGKEKKRNIVHRKTRGGGARVVRTRLIESHITRNAQPTTNRIPTSIALVLITVAKKTHST